MVELKVAAANLLLLVLLELLWMRGPPSVDVSPRTVPL